MILEKIVKKIAYAGILGLTLISGCGISHNSGAINTRFGCLPYPKIGTSFPDPTKLGIHNTGSEKKGQVYTCKAGPIDLAHLRNGADWAKYFSDKTAGHLKRGDREFSFKLDEPSRYFVKLNYPENWTSMSEQQREEIVKGVSNELGQYFSYLGTTWHEILTWFGYKSIGIYSEFHSAFTWEDNFSNLLGAYVAGKAIERGGDFNKAVTKVIDEEFNKLKVQPREVAKKASLSMKEKRHFDIGLDGYVTPWIVSSVSQCGEAVSYPVPSKGEGYGFSMSLEIEPYGMERGKVLGVAGKQNRIVPETDFPVIMDYIKKDAIRRWGVGVDKI